MTVEQSNRATQYTVAFLDLLEDALRIEYRSDGYPIFVPDLATPEVLAHLKAHLYDLQCSSSMDDAITDMTVYSGEGSARIQTTAVGYAADFDLQVKLGLLLGDRLVLWDTVIRSILEHPQSSVHIDMLGMSANSLLRLRGLVNDGALIILPQPRTWLPRAERYYRLMPSGVSENSTFKGYVNAAALLSEGLVLHPYMTLERAGYSSAINRLHDALKPYYSEEKACYHSKLMRVLRDRRMTFIGDLRPAEFYESLRNLDDGALRELQREFCRRLSFPQVGMSPPEMEKHLDEVVAELSSYASETNHRLTARKRAAKYAGLSVVESTFGIVAGATTASLLPTVIAGIGAGGNIAGFLQEVFGAPKNPILYQIFTHLDRAAEQQFLRDLREQEELLGNDEEDLGEST